MRHAGRGARSAPFGGGNELKKTGARSARARTRGQNPLVLNVNLVKYWPKNVYKNTVILFCDGDIKQHGLFSNASECDAPFQDAGVAGSPVM